METTNNNQPMLIDGLSCVCGGSKIYYSTVNVEDMNNINQLALDLCQYFGQKKLKYYADFFSSSSSLCCGVI